MNTINEKDLETKIHKKSHLHTSRIFTFANCQGGLCKCKDFIPVDLNCPPLPHHESICKLRKLLEEPLSYKSYDLHSFYLNNYMNASTSGIYINDMPNLTRVLEILAERIEATLVYRRYLKKILKLSAIIPLVYNNTDKIQGIIHFGKYLSILGLLAIWLTEKKLRIYVYTALLELLTNNVRKYANSVEINFRFVAIENSHLPEIVTQLIEIVAEDEYDYILKISLALSQISNVTCRKMMVTDAANFLLFRLLPCEESKNCEYLIDLPKSRQFLLNCNITCHILINLVSSLKKEIDVSVIKNVTPKDNFLWGIRFLLRGLMYRGIHTRNVRNMLMEFILLSIDIFPHLEIMSTDLATDLAELSVATESVNSAEWYKDIKFENNAEDVCFKKMLLMGLCFIDKYPLLAQIYESKNVIKGLLKLIAPDYVTTWHKNDQDSLRNYAMISLNCMVPAMIKDFNANNGTRWLLKFIKPYIKPAEFYNREELLDMLKILIKVSEFNAKTGIDPSVFLIGYSTLHRLCLNVLGNDCMTYQDQEIMTYCFCTLLCYFDQRSDSCCVLNLPINYLKRVLHPNKHDSCTNSKTVIAAINHMWTILLSKDEKIEAFIKKEGVYVLLDIIDICPLPVQVIGLGCLVDICENQYVLPFLLTWRGVKTKKQIFISLLARIFREECQKIGTRLNANDIIIDVFYPLMGKIQYQNVVTNDKLLDPNSAMADLLGSARPKVYALMQILNSRYKDNVNLINDHYKIGITPIPRNDLIILHLADNFFALKLSEAWHELSQSLIASNIDPIDVDAQMIVNLTEKMQKWNENVQKNQEIIMELEINKEINLELRLYEIFRQCRLQHAIDALRELKYFARTTDRMFREAHKDKQKHAIAGLSNEKQYKIYYKTFSEDLNSTAQFDMEFLIPPSIDSK